MAAKQFPIELGHVLTFARAVGHADEPYLSGDAAVPPTFPMAVAQFDPDYPLRPKSDETWLGSGRTSGLVVEGAGGLHAEQHFTYHRPLRIGDVLTPSTREGETWSKEGRSGTLRFRELITDFHDPSGELVLTARAVGVLTEGPK